MTAADMLTALRLAREVELANAKLQPERPVESPRTVPEAPAPAAAQEENVTAISAARANKKD